MKIKNRFFFFFFFVSVNLFAQKDITTILQKCTDASSQINNGTYTARFRMKYLMRNDTSLLEGSCRFHRLASDTLEGAKFDITTGTTRILYDGRKKTVIYTKDSLAIIYDKWKYPLQLTGSIYHLLSDYIVNNRSRLDVAIHSMEIKKQLARDTMIGNINCYHILLRPNDDETSQNIYRHLYIAKDNYFLMGEVMDLESHQHHQFSELFLHNVEFNIVGLNTNYGTGLIPKFYFVKDYIPDQLSKLLAAGTSAPDFTLPSLEGKNISFSNFFGKISILYFWNGLDQQCRLGLVPLQRLYNKYSVSGVEIMGMNVSDKGNESLKKYLTKEKITFTQLTGAVIAAEKYNVVEVPTVYVIGKNGKVIEGFAPGSKENLEKKLEPIILKNQ